MEPAKPVPAETVPARIDAGANRAAAQLLAKAMRERDHAAIADVLAPDVVINSPITGSFEFHGRADALAVLEIVSEAIDELEHHELVGEGDVWTQRFSARASRRPLEGMDLLRFDEQGRVRELTVFIRPLPGLTAFAAAVVPAVGRRKGFLTTLALRLLIGPLAAMTRHGDRLVGRLLRETWGSGAHAPRELAGTPLRPLRAGRAPSGVRRD